ncbi:hypothetical protein AB4Y35_07380 [Paraburkholderia sp. EG286A]|uniref:hypothetical protein n=1 Tax=Paraburkholderia sp. EG286A TaxID=3237014 RepID=UPI0034D347C9
MKARKPDYTPPPEGTYLTALVQAVFCGRSQRFPDNESGDIAQQFELRALDGQPSLDDNGRGKPPLVWIMPWTFSLYYKAKFAQLWAGALSCDVADLADELDLEDYLGTWFRCEVRHSVSDKTGRTYLNIARLMPLEKGDTIGLPRHCYNKPQAYEIADGRGKVFDSLPGWLQERLMDSPDWPDAGNVTEAAKAKHSDAKRKVKPHPVQRVAQVDKAGRTAPAGGTGFDDMNEDVPF